MQAGDSAAWDQQWEKAIEAYMGAVREFPTDSLACNSLGYALFQAGRLEDALKAYGKAAQIDRNDPLPVEKSADVLERMGRVNEAAQQYLAVAEIYLAQHDLEKAIDNWERATQITPGMVGVHKKLAMAYERIGQKPQAITEYLKLAFNFQAASKSDLAMQALQRALRLDAKEPRLLNALTALRADKPIAAELLETPPDKNAEETDLADFDTSIADADSRGPIGEAVELSLEQLAMQVFESGNMGLAEASAMQGVEFQRANIVDEAISAYQKANSTGFRSPALIFNLGVLMTEAERWQEAIKLLSQITTGGHVLIAGVKHALSLAYIGLEDWNHAAENMIQTLHLVELALSMDEGEQAELNTLYTRAAALLSQSDPQTLQGFSNRLADMLTGADWKRRVTQTRTRMEDMLSKDAQHALEELSRDEGVSEAMDRADQFIAQKRYNLAMDEIHQIILHEPDYLAAHIKAADVLMELTHIQQALQKYNFVSRVYLLRDNPTKATEILGHALKIAPGDLSLRTSLIELLEEQERWPEAIEQYILLGEAYNDIADLSNAKATYEQALKIAGRTNAPQDLTLKILHKMGQVDIERIELRGAQRTYQRIVEIQGDNMDARRALATIYYRLNNPVQGIQEVDKLLQIYARQRRPDLILQTLEEMSGDYPSDMALHARLGRVYMQMNKPDNALAEFEQLRVLQIEAGLNNEAKQTIKQILSLNPAQAEHYQRMLQQMGG